MGLAAVLLVGLWATAAAAEELVYGAPLMVSAQRLEEGRYTSRLSFDETVKFFERKFRGSQSVKWHKVINVPQVKALHIENLKMGGEWEGINVYTKEGEVRLFYLKREEPVPATPSK